MQWFLNPWKNKCLKVTPSTVNSMIRVTMMIRRYPLIMFTMSLSSCAIIIKLRRIGSSIWRSKISTWLPVASTSMAASTMSLLDLFLTKKSKGAPFHRLIRRNSTVDLTTRRTDPGRLFKVSTHILYQDLTMNSQSINSSHQRATKWAKLLNRSRWEVATNLTSQCQCLRLLTLLKSMNRSQTAGSTPKPTSLL